ncbi:MAG TPA: hypothetical protein VK388_03270 [Pyrinomonadaceae bacterium]|nr:hypothetical protein [Pyrinomonadaceae bacterium]
MKRLILFTLLIHLSFIPDTRAQSDRSSLAVGANAIAAERGVLLSQLQLLETKTAKLDHPLAVALAKAEIADAAWSLDESWARQLLIEAYDLTLPRDNDQEGARPVGSPPPMTNAAERARDDARRRVLAVAARGETFAGELIKRGAAKVGRFVEQKMYADLATDALNRGDKKAAGDYVANAIDTDPTQVASVNVILALAAHDRAAADDLTIKYIERLRAFPLSRSDQSLVRSYFILGRLIFGPSDTGDKAPPPGPAVMKAYVSYVIESLSRIAQSDPASLRSARLFLMSAWMPLKQYAPEMAGAFMELEKLSRPPGADASLPQRSMDEIYRERYEQQAKQALKDGQPTDLIILNAASSGDFDKARELIRKLPDGQRKNQLTEAVNVKELLTLSARGDMAKAEGIGMGLKRATSILQVYPVMIKKCLAEKDSVCASRLAYQAVRQLKQSETSTPESPPGVPAAALPTLKEVDPVLLSLGALADAVGSADESLALEILEEVVKAANASFVDTTQGRIGFDARIFRKLASKNEPRVLTVAEELKDPLRRVVATAAVFQWKAEELQKKARPSITAKKTAAN